MIYWFFGLPGSGKTYAARRFSRLTGIPAYEGDDFHTEEDRRAVAAGAFTLAHRHAQLERIQRVLQAHAMSGAIVTHPLPDKASRILVKASSAVPVRLVYVTAPLPLIRSRLETRTDHHFGVELLDAWIPKHWQEPTDEDVFVLHNHAGAPPLESQLRRL